ncbi:MAG: hypothetical protein ACRC10_10480 [Thermoguttaceae bacterium]
MKTDQNEEKKEKELEQLRSDLLKRIIQNEQKRREQKPVCR